MAGAEFVIERKGPRETVELVRAGTLAELADLSSDISYDTGAGLCYVLVEKHGYAKSELFRADSPMKLVRRAREKSATRA